MPAHDQTPAHSGIMPGPDVIANQAEELLSAGEIRVWLFRCPQCQGIGMLTRLSDEASCRHCGHGPWHPFTVDDFAAGIERAVRFAHGMRSVTEGKL